MSSKNNRSLSLQRRPARTIPMLIVSLVLIAIGVLAVIAVYPKLTGGDLDPSVQSAADQTLQTAVNDPVVLGVGIGVAVIGLILLLCAIIPGSYKVSTLNSDAASRLGSSTETVLTNRGSARIAAATAQRVDGVQSATGSMKGSKLNVTVNTPLRDTSQTSDWVRSEVQSTVESIPYTRPPSVNVNAQRSQS